MHEGLHRYLRRLHQHRPNTFVGGSLPTDTVNHNDSPLPTLRHEGLRQHLRCLYINITSAKHVGTRGFANIFSQLQQLVSANTSAGGASPSSLPTIMAQEPSSVTSASTPTTAYHHSRARGTTSTPLATRRTTPSSTTLAREAHQQLLSGHLPPLL